MAQSYYGSINYDKLLESLKKGIIKTHKSENGTRYVYINIYIADQPDQYKNDGSVSAPLKDEFKQDNTKVVFVGNLRKSTPQETTPEDFKEEDDDIPF